METEVRSQKLKVRRQKINPLTPPLVKGGKGGFEKCGLGWINNSSRITRLSLFILIFCFLLFTASSAMAVSQDISDMLKSHLKEKYPWSEIEINDMASSEEIPADLPERLIVEKSPPGRTVFWMEYKNGKKITASAYVKAFDWVVMCRRAFRKGYLLQKDDVYMTIMDVTRIPKGAIKSDDQIVGKALTRSIITNTPIVDNMISGTAQVKKGRKVVLLVESPAFSITTVGEIKESNHVGNYVKVVNLSSKKVITGLLVDENTVKVEL